MNEIEKKLKDLIYSLDWDNTRNNEKLMNAKNSLNLYISEFFNNKSEFKDLIDDVDTEPSSNIEYDNSRKKLKSTANILLEVIEINGLDISVKTEEERKKILEETKKEVELEWENIHKNALEIEKMREELQVGTDKLLLEVEKFNIIKSKNELTDKELDFQIVANKNKKTAIIWAGVVFILIFILVYLLLDSLTKSDTFIKIATQVKKELIDSKNLNDDIITNTIYFSFSKYVFTKLLFYSMLIFAIVFCIKNYNAQMHNHIINTHKFNALRSTLSLLGTARSDEGNDKLLIQATQAIFSHQQTGYSGKESEQTSPNLITNVIDSISK